MTEEQLRKNANRKQYDFYEETTCKMMRQVREKHGISQSTMGRFLGVSAQTVSKIERGVISPKSKFFINLLLQMESASALPDPTYRFPWKIEGDKECRL